MDVEENPSPSLADVLVCTPEKFDLYCRTWTDHLGWLSKVDLLVVDELHTLDTGRRGATLEGLITRFKTINPYARVMGLSATLGNPDALAKWIGGEAFISNDRPIPLSWRIRAHARNEPKADVVVEEVKETLAQNGQVIVFVQSRPRTESLVKRLADCGIVAAAHHAGLSKAKRDKAEAGFRSGEIGALVATGSVGMGINFPARKVVLHDLQRWEGGAWEDLSTNEVWQLAGRAGRRGLDASGEVVLIAPAWNQVAARRYIKGQFEPINSQLIFDTGFCEQLMVTFGSRMALKTEQAQRIMANTLMGQAHTPGEIAKKVDASVAEMVRADMLDQNELGYIRATRIGRIATRFQLTAKTVISWKRLEASLPDATLFDLLVAMCAAPDFTARLRVDHDDVVLLQDAIDREPMQLRTLTEVVRKSVMGQSGKDLIGAVRTALVLRAWTRLGDVDEAAELFGAQTHEVEEARKEAVRLLQAFSAMVNSKPRKVADEGLADEAGLVEKAGALCAMVCAGLDDEGATLALIDGVGPVMARRLVGAGFEDIETLAQADPSEVAAVDGISFNRAGKWIEQAGELVTKGGAFRYREVCKEYGQTTGSRNGLARGLDFYRWMRAKDLTVEVIGAQWEVTGGSEPHSVMVAADGLLECDCADARKGRLCKHKIAVLHLQGDPEIPRFDTGFPSGDGGFVLEEEWSNSAYGGQKWR